MALYESYFSELALSPSQAIQKAAKIAQETLYSQEAILKANQMATQKQFQDIANQQLSLISGVSQQNAKNLQPYIGLGTEATSLMKDFLGIPRVISERANPKYVAQQSEIKALEDSLAAKRAQMDSAILSGFTSPAQGVRNTVDRLRSTDDVAGSIQDLIDINSQVPMNNSVVSQLQNTLGQVQPIQSEIQGLQGQLDSARGALSGIPQNLVRSTQAQPSRLQKVLEGFNQLKANQQNSLGALNTNIQGILSGLPSAPNQGGLQ